MIDDAFADSAVETIISPTRDVRDLREVEAVVVIGALCMNRCSVTLADSSSATGQRCGDFPSGWSAARRSMIPVPPSGRCLNARGTAVPLPISGDVARARCPGLAR